MVSLKSCPRCQGATYFNRDMYGPYRQCIHCGHTTDMDRLDSGFQKRMAQVRLEQLRRREDATGLSA